MVISGVAIASSSVSYLSRPLELTKKTGSWRWALFLLSLSLSLWVAGNNLGRKGAGLREDNEFGDLLCSPPPPLAWMRFCFLCRVFPGDNSLVSHKSLFSCLCATVSCFYLYYLDYTKHDNRCGSLPCTDLSRCKSQMWILYVTCVRWLTGRKHKLWVRISFNSRQAKTSGKRYCLEWSCTLFFIEMFVLPRKDVCWGVNATILPVQSDKEDNYSVYILWLNLI